MPPAEEGARTARLSAASTAVIGAVLGLERDPDHAFALVPQLPDYLQAAEAMWLFVDGWRAP